MKSRSRPLHFASKENGEKLVNFDRDCLLRIVEIVCHLIFLFVILIVAIECTFYVFHEFVITAIIFGLIICTVKVVALV